MLQRVTVLARPFGGFQNVTAYQLKQGDESGDPVTRILPRVADGAAGLPELHEPGSLDPVDPGAGRWARRRWSYDWTECGDRRLDRIALQGNGSARPPRPVHQPWNRQGMANNMVQRIPVLVRGT